MGADGGPGVDQSQLVDDGQGRHHVARATGGPGPRCRRPTRPTSPGPRPKASARAMCMSAVVSPSRLASPEKSPPASAGSTGGRRLRQVDDRHRLGVVHAEQVAQRGQGQGPPVDRPGQEGLEEGEVVAVAGLGGQGLGHPREADPGQGRGDLDLGVGPGQQPAEQLEDELLVVDEGRVRLLHADGPDPLGRRVAAADVPVQVQAEVGVEGGVVGRRRHAVDLDRRRAPRPRGRGGSRAARPRAAARPAPGSSCRRPPPAAGPAAGQPSRSTSPADHLDRRRLVGARVPPLPGQVLAEHGVGDGGHRPGSPRRRGRHASTSWNQ